MSYIIEDGKLINIIDHYIKHNPNCIGNMYNTDDLPKSWGCTYLDCENLAKYGCYCGWGSCEEHINDIHI